MIFGDVYRSLKNDDYVILLDDESGQAVYSGYLKNAWIAIRVNRAKLLDVSNISNHIYSDGDISKQVKAINIKGLTKYKIRRSA